MQGRLSCICYLQNFFPIFSLQNRTKHLYMQKRYFPQFYISIFFLLFCCIHLYGQHESIDKFDQDYVNWYNLDYKQDDVVGTSVDKAYKELLKDKKPSKKIVVAVIDSGIDIDHEDLKGRIWTNEDEIPDNNIDDDKNGFVDDVHGWNFLGNSEGENMMFAHYEYTRIYKKFHEKYKDLASADKLTAKEKKDYLLYKSAAANYTKELEKHTSEKDQISGFSDNYYKAKELIKPLLNGKKLSLESVRNLEGDDELSKALKEFFLKLFEAGFQEDGLEHMLETNDNYLNYHLNLDFDPREIIADSPYDMANVNYGNPNVKGQRSSHGTSVGGVIAALRNNDLGINGIAENVELMVLRTVPKGDEYDKDIALSIRYAVDNGANIINMSFGKGYSPNKEFVDEAAKYAALKNVLLIHAAGNESTNVDEEPRYPSDKYLDGTDIPNWINVGASAKDLDKYLAASFSNYGKDGVDLFAPGHEIISVHPNNKYDTGSGTSLAAPIVSGVAALVWSYYPDLTAVELKEILVNSAYPIKRPKVIRPSGMGKSKKTKFKHLSIAGGIVNAYEALLLAEKLKK